MNEELQSSYCGYLELMGHRIVQTRSTVWVDIRKRIYQPAAPFQTERITQSEVEEVLQSGKAIACRWFSQTDDPVNTDKEASSLAVYLAHSPYDLSSLQGDARRKTRRGLERVEVRKVNLSAEIERLAYPIYVENVRRAGLMNNQKRIDRRWKTWVAAILGSQCVDFWTAWQSEKLLAFMVAVRTPWGTQFVLHRSSLSGLPLYPNNALYYLATRDAFDSGSRVVSTGLSAFGGEHDSLHDFKSRMGFKAVPLAEKFAWAPFMKPIEFLTHSDQLRKFHSVVSRLRRLSRTF